MKFNKEFLWNASFWVFLVTIAAYGVVILFQITFFDKFGIDSGILKLNIDPAALFLAAFIIGMAFLFVSTLYYYIKFLNLVARFGDKMSYKIKDVLAPIFFIVAICMILFQLTLYPNSYNHEYTQWVEVAGQYAVLVVTGLHIALRLHEVLKTRRKDHLSLKRAYWKTVSKRDYFFSNRKEKSRNFRPVGLVFLSLSAVIFPYFCAAYIADNQKSFTSIESSKYTGLKDVKVLIIGRTDDGFIVKKYNTKSTKFESGFSIVKEDELDFGRYDIKK